VFAAAAETGAARRIAFAEGEDDRVLRAMQVVVDEGLARPVLIGRHDIITARISELGLRLAEGRDYEVAGLDDEQELTRTADAYYARMRRRGLTPSAARIELRRDTTLIGAMLLQDGRVDGLLCGTFGTYAGHLRHVANAVGLAEGARGFAAMNLLMLPRQTVFVCDTYINPDPDAEELAHMALLAAEEVRRFGLTPRVALLSHSSFGSADTQSAVKMRRARELLEGLAPELEVEGEMHADAALSKRILDQIFPGSRLTGEANLLLMPNLDAANITFNALKIVAGEGVTVGPILLGAAKPVHILTPTSTVRRIVNMTALTVVDATIGRQAAREGGRVSPAG
jgi:malate dehydrogenase (oxaloacetate-decarboxylating)(NADP+)